MSYDVWLECPTCNEPLPGCEWNYTSNISPMLHCVSVSIGITGWDNMTTRSIYSELTDGIAALESSPERFVEMNPENGWGSYDGLLNNFLVPIREACSAHPSAIVKVSA